MVGRNRLKISRAWEIDGYRVAEAKYYGDENPEPSSPEGAQLAQLAAALEALADQWIDRVKCALSPLRRWDLDGSSWSSCQFVAPAAALQSLAILYWSEHPLQNCLNSSRRIANDLEPCMQVAARD